MKRREVCMKRIKVTLIVLFCMVLACCVHGARVMLYGPAAPSKALDAEVQVFSTSLPDRPYVELGEIITTNHNNQTNLEQIKAEARKMGADAVILQGATRAVSATMPIGGGITAGTSRQYGLRAVGIRWK
jgi:accessory colonization factor AcfC